MNNTFLKKAFEIIDKCETFNKSQHKVGESYYAVNIPVLGLYLDVTHVNDIPAIVIVVKLPLSTKKVIKVYYPKTLEYTFDADEKGKKFVCKTEDFGFFSEYNYPNPMEISHLIPTNNPVFSQENWIKNKETLEQTRQAILAQNEATLNSFETC